MNGSLQDLRYALRQLRKSPGFTTVAVLTLALGIAANTVIFSVMNATILKRLNFPNPDRLVLVWQTYGKDPNNINIISAPNFWDFKRMSHVFEDMAIFDSAGRGYNLAAPAVKSLSRSQACEFQRVFSMCSESSRFLDEVSLLKRSLQEKITKSS